MRTQWGRAAAEFVVIVAGVVAGLAADGWRGDRGDRLEETLYLQRLQADLRLDSAQIATGLQVIRSKIGPLERLIDWTEGSSDLSTVAAASLLAEATAYAWNMPRSSSATFDELVSAGRLGLLDDPLLRNAVSRYYSTYFDRLATIDARRTRFGPLSYELVRRPPQPANGDIQASVDFQAAELTPAALDALASPVVRTQIGRVATAELAYSGWAISRLLELQNLGAGLLSELRRHPAR